jgi:hypothetical protein
MTRPHAQHLALAASALLCGAGAARAKVYTEWQPRVTVGAGYDDNILLDGQGGDPFGQVMPGLKLFLFGDHGLRSTLDCQVGLSRLQHPDAFQAAGGTMVLDQLCGVDVKSRLGTRSALHIDLKTQYAQDPFSIANMGLLLRPGQRQIFQTRLRTELSYRESIHGTVLLGVDEESLYFTRGDPGNGLLVTPHVAYERRTSAVDTFSGGLREQMFFSLGTDATVPTWSGSANGLSTAAIAGWKHRLSHVADFQLYAGPALLSRPGSTNFVPMARATLEVATPTSALHLTALHDLVLGPGRGGPLIGDLGEAAVSGNLSESFVAHLRAGIYRNTAVGSDVGGVVGYGAGVGLDWLFARAWTLGAGVGREARLSGDAVDHSVDRNVVQLRLTWEAPRI